LNLLGRYDKRCFFATSSAKVRRWHIATFRCAAKIGRYRGKPDVRQRLSLNEFTPLEHSTLFGIWLYRLRWFPRSGGFRRCRVPRRFALCFLPVLLALPIVLALFPQCIGSR
jgi:hypothetical protein